MRLFLLGILVAAVWPRTRPRRPGGRRGRRRCGAADGGAGGAGGTGGAGGRRRGRDGRLELGTDALSFGRVAPFETAELTTTLHNPGGCAAALQGIRIDGPRSFSVLIRGVDPGWIGAARGSDQDGAPGLAAGGTVEVVVRFSPPDDAPAEGSLVVEGAGGPLALALSGNRGGACVHAVPPTLERPLRRGRGAGYRDAGELRGRAGDRPGRDVRGGRRSRLHPPARAPRPCRSIWRRRGRVGGRQIQLVGAVSSGGRRHLRARWRCRPPDPSTPADGAGCWAGRPRGRARWRVWVRTTPSRSGCSMWCSSMAATRDPDGGPLLYAWWWWSDRRAAWPSRWSRSSIRSDRLTVASRTPRPVRSSSWMCPVGTCWSCGK
ncbi:MAG: hypothetical protein R3F43_18875 [bacterium]